MNQDDEYRGAIAVKKAASMKKVGQDESGWEIYYDDNLTGEHWVMDYPDSGLHGGGPPRLRRLPGEIRSPSL
jgi:hypothetical protein